MTPDPKIKQLRELKEKAKLGGGENPACWHVAGTVADEGDDLALDRSAPFLEGEDVGENLAGMLVIGERIHCGNVRELGELFDVVLSERPDDRAVDHPAEHAGGVLHGFAAAHLDFVGDEE